MHIIIIPSWYKTSKQPLTGTFFEEQARMLIGAGHKVGILYPNHIGSFSKGMKHPWPQISYTNDNGLPTIYSTSHSIAPGHWGFFFNIFIIRWAALLSYKKYCKRHGSPDIIHAHSVLWGGVVAQYLSKQKRLPYVITEHLSTLIRDKEFDIPPYRQFVIKAFRSAANVVFVSNLFRQKIAEKFEITNVSVIHNVINPIFFLSFHPILKTPLINLIAIGNFISNKRFDIYIETIRLLKMHGLKVNAKLIGTGPLQINYQKQIDTLNLQNEILIVPLQSRKEIAQAISECHVLISTSEFETFGMTIAEAHAVGRPTVVYDAGGPRDIVNSTNGIIVSELTADAFAKAIIKVWENYELYDANAISKECFQKFSEEIISEKLNTLYQSVIRNSEHK